MVTPSHEAKHLQINDKHLEIVRPMGAFRALYVNTRLTAIFGPLLMGQVADCSKALMGLTEADSNDLFSKLFHGVRFHPEDGSTPLELQDVKNIDAVFAGDLEGIYSLAFSVLEYEKFPFFKDLREQAGKFLEIQDKIQKALSAQAQEALDKASGSGIPATAGSSKPTPSGRKTQTPLGT